MGVETLFYSKFYFGIKYKMKLEAKTLFFERILNCIPIKKPFFSFSHGEFKDGSANVKTWVFRVCSLNTHLLRLFLYRKKGNYVQQITPKLTFSNKSK